MLSVIIPTCDRVELLKKCLDRLHPSVQSLSPILYEIIITDDSRNNISEEFIKDHFNWIKYVAGPRKGPAANRNNGAKKAKGEWLIFIDDDCLPDERLLIEYKKGIKNNSCCLAFEGAIFPDSWQLLQKDMAECPVNTDGGCFWSANICVNTELFKQIGGFDESYLIAAQEDQQLKLDIQKNMQNNIVFLRDAKVTHPVRFSSVRKRIIHIPDASKNFCLYAYKNKKVLGYSSVMKFFIDQMHVQSKNLYQSIKQKKFKNCIIAFIFLVYAVPLNLINFYSFSKKFNQSMLLQ